MCMSKSNSSMVLNKEAAPYKPLKRRSEIIPWLPLPHPHPHHPYQYGAPVPQLSVYMPRYFYTYTCNGNAYSPLRACPYYGRDPPSGLHAQHCPPMEVYRLSKWTLSKHANGSEGKRRMHARKGNGMRRHARKGTWSPKNGEQVKFYSSVAANDVGVDLAGCSTLMLKNIPNKLQRSDLLAFLDKHCKRVNKESAALGSESVLSAYDFVYLPMDFEKNANKGYAFVNFTTSIAAIRATREFHMLEWATLNFNKKDVLMSKKICEVSVAKFQGKERLTEHFHKSVFPCHTDEYLPVVFSPPRDGSSLLSNLQLVGQCMG